jgi:hypothetical protein
MAVASASDVLQDQRRNSGREQVGDVCKWHLADVLNAHRDVCFGGKADMPDRLTDVRF